jgi:hypothetical protein
VYTFKIINPPKSNIIQVFEKISDFVFAIALKGNKCKSEPFGPVTIDHIYNIHQNIKKIERGYFEKRCYEVTPFWRTGVGVWLPQNFCGAYLAIR